MNTFIRLPLLIAAGALVLMGCNLLSQTAPSDSAGVVFESLWDSAVGMSRNAVTDGGRWPTYFEYNADNSQLLAVVPGGVNGHNALRIQQRGPRYAAILQVDNVVPESQDFYLRFYMKNEDTSGMGDHTVTVDARNYGNLTFLRKYSDISGWEFDISMYGCGGSYPIAHWGPPGQLAHGKWYRFEYFVHYADPDEIQVRPRVYDSNDVLLYTDVDFQQQDFKAGGIWNGRDDWTLASYYAADRSFCADPAWTNDFGLGNNGQRDATDTGRHWYFSAVQIRRDTWPGPVGPAPTR